MSEAELDQLPDELTVTLRRPVTFPATNGETYSELRLREPTADQMSRAAARQGVDSDIYLIFLTSGVPIGAVEQVGDRDRLKATNFLSQFTPEFPKAGDPEELPDELVLPLRKAIGPGGEIDELRLREPMAGERKKVMDAYGVAGTIALIALVAGIPAQAVGQLVARDLRKAAIYLGGFTSGGPETGARV